MRTIVVGTRESQLAQRQTGQVIERLRQICVQQGIACEFKTKTIVTKGDQILNVTLSKVGGKGLFVKEIEQALLNGEIDLAVHSMKDMPYELPEGLIIGAIPTREDIRDALISIKYRSLEELPEGAVVGTSSLRREAQLRHRRPDLIIQPLRGNIDTRLRKLETENFDAIILASAGLKRMGWTNRITQYLEAEKFIPAVGQGALAIECREDDAFIRSILQHIQDDETAMAVRAERAFLGKMEGSCQIPIGAFAKLIRREDGLKVHLIGMVGTPDGIRLMRQEAYGDHPEEVGTNLAMSLLDHGAHEILKGLSQ